MDLFGSAKNKAEAEKKATAEIIEAIKKALPKKVSSKLIAIDYPPQNNLGDYTVPCFLLAKKLKQPPVELAEFLAKNIEPAGLISRIEAKGPYLNFFTNQKVFTELVLKEIFKKKSRFGKNISGKGKRVMVEYFSPNTNKPLTIGHVRNICLGQSLVNLMKLCGYKVIQSTLYNDRGIAIAKTIVGYQKWGNGQTPKEAGLKPDHFVGSFYVKFCQQAKIEPELEKEAKKVLQEWEKGSKEIKVVWQKLMTWVLDGFKETLADLKIGKFDEEYYESEHYQSGKEAVEKGLKKGVFVKDSEGVILAPLQKYGLPDKIVLRPDDTSLYVTQDLYLAYLKEKYQLDQSIYVVGSEQDLYFKQLFKILELLGFLKAPNYHHLSYGMIRLPDGKIKSREGLIKGTGADDLLAELNNLAETEIKKRFPDLVEAEIEKRAGQISLAALKFYILAVSPATTMVFDPAQSIAFAGRTGPYLQYVAARINSIFAKGKEKPSIKIDFAKLDNELEFAIVKLLSRFPGIVSAAVKNFDPSILANYLFDLAKAFSLFYEKLPVLNADKEVKAARLLLIYDVKTILAIGLELLGIEVLEKM